MGEDASTVTSPSPKQLREACARTRARITAHVDEVEARLRGRLEAVVGTPAPRTAQARPGAMELLRVMNRLTGPGVTATLVGAAVGYFAVRPWTSRRS